MTALHSQIRLQKVASRWLGAGAALLGASAAVHLVVLFATGGEWGGAVSFRKPFTFAFSVGLILWTSGWVLDRLPARPRLERILAAVLIPSGLLEVGLITAQTWRGVPSHFNSVTPQDGLIFSLMGIAIGVFSVGLGVILAWALLQRPVDRSTRLAVLAGMALVMLGLGTGAWIIGLGLEMAERLGQAPDTVLAGEAGVAKFPHAMALHGIQLFIGVSIAGAMIGIPEKVRLRTTRFVVAGYGLLVAWAIVHTNAGRAPTDLGGVEAALLWVGTALMVMAGVSLADGWRQTRAVRARVATPPPATIGS